MTYRTSASSRFCTRVLGVLVVAVGTSPVLADSVVLWNKLGNDADILNSEIGVNGELTAPVDYAPVQHGNGVALQSGTAQVKFSGLFGTSFPDAGTIEFWWVPAHDENSGSGSHFDEREPIWISSDERMPGNWPALRIGIRHHCCDNVTVTDLAFNIYDNDTGISYSFGQKLDVDYVAGQVLHVAITWDKGLGAAPVKAYFDGVEAVPVLVGGENPEQLIDKIQEKISNPAFTYDMELLRRSKRPDGAANQYDPDCYVDNVVVSNFAKTDFSGRFDENPVTQIPASSSRSMQMLALLLLAGIALVLALSSRRRAA